MLNLIEVTGNVVDSVDVGEEVELEMVYCFGLSKLCNVNLARFTIKFYQLPKSIAL